MNKDYYYRKSDSFLRKLCVEISERCVGSEGNREATLFFETELASMGWVTEIPEFSAMDWKDGGATLKAGDTDFKVLVSSYSLGCSIESQMLDASNTFELENGDFRDKIILLHGEIAKEQLMPKNFVFYNPEEHQKIISLLEKSGANALICATGRNPSLAGGVYPFPRIEDGDFNIPSVYMTEDEGAKFLPFTGSRVILHSDSKRIPGNGFNVIGKKGNDGSKRIVVTAHIDAKKGTPGAIDNATGVVVLLLLAEMLKDYSGARQIEIVAFNGEDYYAVPGQMNFIQMNQAKFSEMLVNINIDGAGYKEGNSALSLYKLPLSINDIADEIIRDSPGIIKGKPWPQGDHSIFILNGVPAIAASSQWFTENIDSQDITHTPRDNLDIVDSHKVVELAEALDKLIRRL